jgi:flagellar biosynthesis GTPase FlhF
MAALRTLTLFATLTDAQAVASRTFRSELPELTFESFPTQYAQAVASRTFRSELPEFTFESFPTQLEEADDATSLPKLKNTVYKLKAELKAQEKERRRQNEEHAKEQDAEQAAVDDPKAMMDAVQNETDRAKDRVFWCKHHIRDLFSWFRITDSVRYTEQKFSNLQNKITPGYLAQVKEFGISGNPANGQNHIMVKVNECRIEVNNPHGGNVVLVNHVRRSMRQLLYACEHQTCHP